MKVHIHFQKMVAVFLSLLAGCTSTRLQGPTESNALGCEKGHTCVLEGQLFVYRGSPASVAELRTANGCFAVALTTGDYARFHKRMGARVRVSGPSYDQGAADGVVSYRLRDRDVATGICSAGLVIYATKVELLSAR